MTAHQRRPGFRLPWSSEGDQAEAPSAEADAQPAAAAEAAEPTQQSPDEMGDHAAAESAGAADETNTQAADAGQQPEGSEMTATAPAPSEAAEATEPTAATGFLSELVSAMRRVAEETRAAAMAELRSRAEEAIRGREQRLEQRRNELRANAEADVAKVGEWAKSEAERIKAEAEQRVAARRTELEQQLAAEAARRELDPAAVHARVAAYEAELDRFYSQLASIQDPAAFAAAATRMPAPPALDGEEAATPAATEAGEATAEHPAADQSADEAETSNAGTNGTHPAEPVTDDAGSQVAAAELQELEAADAGGDAFAEPVATEIVVKGLGSFGAITGFRQQLAGVDGIDAVGLSLGTSGEFVFRATHRPSLDVSAAITTLEGEGTVVEPRPEGGLKVTLGRPR